MSPLNKSYLIAATAGLVLVISLPAVAAAQLPAATQATLWIMAVLVALVLMTFARPVPRQLVGTVRHWRYGAARYSWKVSHITDPTRVGVARPVHEPYVARPEDAELAGALAGSGMRCVVLHGPPGAGKHRMAYEAVRSQLPGYFLFRPTGKEQLRSALSEAPRRPGSVIWLDQLDLEGDSELFDLLNNALSETDRQLVVLAVVDSEVFERLLPTPAVSDPMLPVRIRAARLLGKAHVIAVTDPWPLGGGFAGDQERQRLIELYEEWWASAPLTAAIVAACADWRRLGFPATSAQTLRAICGGYLVPPVSVVGSKAFRRALRQARKTEPTAPAISRNRDGRFVVDPCFVRIRRHGIIAEATWRYAVGRASGFDAYQVGVVARSMHRLDHAERALRRAAIDNVPDARYLHALVTGEAGRPQLAITMLDALLTIGQDPVHRTTLGLVKAEFLAESGRFGQAIQEAQALLGTCSPDSKESFAVRHAILRFRCEAGYVDEALLELEDLAREYQSRHPDDRVVLFEINHSIAYWSAWQDRGIAVAIQRFEQLIADFDAEFSDNWPPTVAARINLARLRGDSGNPARAANELARADHMISSQLGGSHYHALRIRANRAWWLARSGDVGQAIDLYRRVVPESHSSVGETHRFALAARRDFALCLATERGHFTEAADLLENVVRAKQEIMDPDHPLLLHTLRELAVLRGRVDPERACELLRGVLDRMERVLDPEAEAIRATRDALVLYAGTSLVHLGIQAMYWKDGTIAGYEMLFRDSAVGGAAIGGGASAASAVMVNTFTTFDVRKLVDELDLSLGITREFVVGALPIPIAPDNLVLQIEDTVTLDDEVAAGIRALAGRGYRIALGSGRWSPLHTALLPEVAYVEIDVRATDRTAARQIARECWAQGRPPVLVATRVDTADHYEFAEGRLGCELFQGRALDRPYVLSRRPLPASPQLHLGLVKKLLDVDTVHIREVIRDVKSDVALSSAVVKWCNSAAAGRPQPVSSVDEAVVAIGLKRVRDIVILRSIAGLTEYNEGTMVSMLAWTRMHELVARRLHVSASKAFLAGLMSEIAVFRDQPIAEIVEEYQLTGEMEQALIDRDGSLGIVVSVVAAYKEGGFETDSRVPNFRLRTIFLEAYADSASLAKSIL
jgi:EAL and modified HD-GYP domain-containing signal transduction protein